MREATGSSSTAPVNYGANTLTGSTTAFLPLGLPLSIAGPLFALFFACYLICIAASAVRLLRHASLADLLLPEVCSGCDGCEVDCGDGVGCGATVAPTSCWTRPRLLGDALGTKSWLAEHGVGTDFYLGQYYQGVTTGGNEQWEPLGSRGLYHPECMAGPV